MTRLESPIEGDMLNALMAVEGDRLVVLDGATIGRISQLALEDSERRHIFVAPQVTVGPYRADFILGAYRNPMYPGLVCLECDGAEWHRANDAQRQRDAERNRYFAGKMIQPVRFTGKQIYRDPHGCAHRAIEAVTGGNSKRNNHETEGLGAVLSRAFPHVAGVSERSARFNGGRQ